MIVQDENRNLSSHNLQCKLFSYGLGFLQKAVLVFYLYIQRSGSTWYVLVDTWQLL